MILSSCVPVSFPGGPFVPCARTPIRPRQCFSARGRLFHRFTIRSTVFLYPLQNQARSRRVVFLKKFFQQFLYCSCRRSYRIYAFKTFSFTFSPGYDLITVEFARQPPKKTILMSIHILNPVIPLFRLFPLAMEVLYHKSNKSPDLPSSYKPIRLFCKGM